MADGVWSRQGVPMYSSSSSSAAGLFKRPRTEYESLSSGLVSGQEMRNYMVQDDDRSAIRVVRDTDAIGSAYDRYLQATQVSSYSSGDASNLAAAGLGRAMVGGISGVPVAESLVRSHPRTAGSDLLQNGQGIGVGGQVPVDIVSRRGHEAPVDIVSRRGHEAMSLPPEASKTLYVEGLPPDTTRREVAHIFRPFVGYKEVRLVFKESKHHFMELCHLGISCDWEASTLTILRGDPIILCFVDFADPACAATAMSALQGYEMDEQNPDSAVLRIQFSRYGPRSAAAGSRGRR